MRIVALTRDHSAGAAYRARLPMQALAQHGHRTDVLEWAQGTPPPPLELLRDADVVHMWRHFRQPAQNFAARLKQAGVAIVFDNDDDLTRVPKGSPAYADMRENRTEVAQALTRMMRLSDLVTTTCGELAGRLRRLGAGDVRIVENYIEPGFVRSARPSKKGVVIGWVAASEHRGDLKVLGLRRTFGQLLEDHPDVRLVSVGLDLDVRSDRYEHHRPMQLAKLPTTIATFDLALAPLADTSFNRVRSNIKVKEYAAAGVPWLASAIGPYKGLGEEQGGRLVTNFGWADELAALIEDDAARAQLAERAAAWGKTQTVTGNAEKWEAVFAEAAERAGSRSAGRGGSRATATTGRTARRGSAPVAAVASTSPSPKREAPSDAVAVASDAAHPAVEDAAARGGGATPRVGWKRILRRSRRATD